MLSTVSKIDEQSKYKPNTACNPCMNGELSD